jgi:hypothetical protein
MIAKVLTLTLSLLLITLVLHIPANAQVEKATFHLDSFSAVMSALGQSKELCPPTMG